MQLCKLLPDDPQNRISQTLKHFTNHYSGARLETGAAAVGDVNLGAREGVAGCGGNSSNTVESAMLRLKTQLLGGVTTHTPGHLLDRTLDYAYRTSFYNELNGPRGEFQIEPLFEEGDFRGAYGYRQSRGYKSAYRSLRRWINYK